MIDERRTGAGGVLWLPAGTIAVIACCVGKRRLASIRVTALDAVTDPALYAGERGFFLNNGSVKVSATRSAALRSSLRGPGTGTWSIIAPVGVQRLNAPTHPSLDADTNPLLSTLRGRGFFWTTTRGSRL